MKTLNSLFILFIFSSLIACTNKPFLPLYQDNKTIEKTALLIAPIELDLVYHNDKRKSLSPPYQAMVNYRLLPGKHLLGFRYQDLHVNDDKDDEIITSKITLLRFEAKAGEVYTIDFQKPKNFEEAKKIEDIFQINLVNNNQIIATSKYAKENISDSSLFSGVAFSENVDEIFQENKLLADDNDTPPSREENAIEHLKYWWVTASKREKEDFSQWLESR